MAWEAGDAVGVRLPSGVGVSLGVGISETVEVGEGVCVGSGVEVSVGVSAGVSVASLDGEGVGDGVSVGTSVGGFVGVSVAVCCAGGAAEAEGIAPQRREHGQNDQGVNCPGRQGPKDGPRNACLGAPATGRPCADDEVRHGVPPDLTRR